MTEKVALDINPPYNHISIKVKDLGASLRFYRDLLGLPVERRLDEPEIVWLPGLELSQLKKGEEFAFTGHIGLGVRNIEEACAYLEEQRLEFDTSLKDVVWEQMGKGLKLAFFKDPDGISVELVQWRDL
ncbi:MAG: VOC family protein [Chloroflexota bacterium]|nr:VOC family protein [Chloroflexota bacterium]